MTEKRANLVALIEHLDDRIGDVIQTLKDQGIYENTLLIFTSDNGGHLPDFANNGPFRDGKQSMYEGGLRVPTCISWPLKIKKGVISNTNWLSMDLFPTLLEVADLESIVVFESKSMLGELIDQDVRDNETRTFYFTRREGGSVYNGSCSYAGWIS